MRHLPEWKYGSVIADGRRRDGHISVPESLCKRIVVNLELSQLKVERKRRCQRVKENALKQLSRRHFATAEDILQGHLHTWLFW